MKKTKLMETIKTVHKISFSGSLKSIAVVKAIDWYPSTLKMPRPFILDEDYVVCCWHDYHDGEKSNIEGKTTIAICRDERDAYELFGRHILLEKEKNKNRSKHSVKSPKKQIKV